MADTRIQGYAAAIFAIANAEDVADRVSDELFRIARTFESSNELRETMSNPQLPIDRKHAIFDDLLGGRALEATVGFVNYVVSLGRASDLPAIADELVAKAAGSRDKVVGEVRSAIPLDDATVGRLTRALSKRTNKDVEVRVVVDPDVVGGIVARVGDVVIDGTVKTRLTKLREALTG
jgi:F-type H+-transporting ATPase subunit delta